MTNRFQVKICGITRLENALFACKLGADALGFIFYEKSPRYISYQDAQKIYEALPDYVAKIGVFVSPNASDIQQCYSFFEPDFIQIHGEHRLDELAVFGTKKLLPALQVKQNIEEKMLAAYQGKCAGILLDAYKPGLYGGTGSTFDWQLALAAKKYHPVVLSGGLNPDNIRAAVKQVQPTAIDVNSGVESAPGVKDHQKLRKLFQQIEDFRHDGDFGKSPFLSTR